MRDVVDEYDQRVLIGEIYLPIERLVSYYGDPGEGVHLPFNFQLILLPWNARLIAAAIEHYEQSLPEHGWPNWVLGNHDKSRIASRVGAAQARVAAMLLVSLRGTPTMYYGDEIGMHDVAIPPEAVQDPREKNEPGLGVGRDPERTPMQWDRSPNAGFTSGEPWLPVADDYRQNNVEVERDDPHSILSLYRRLIELRRSEPALSMGSYTDVPDHGDLVAYLRCAGKRRFLVVLNLGSQKQIFDLADVGSGRIVLSTYLDHADDRVDGRSTCAAMKGL
jgi:alpha-glucosidase